MTSPTLLCQVKNELCQLKALTIWHLHGTAGAIEVRAQDSNRAEARNDVLRDAASAPRQTQSQGPISRIGPSCTHRDDFSIDELLLYSGNGERVHIYNERPRIRHEV